MSILMCFTQPGFACEKLCPNPDYQDFLEQTFGDFNQSDDRFIFVSTSMPIQTLIQYEQAAQQYGFHLILQGLINDSYQDTMAFLAPFTDATKGGISIDPELFQKFHIQQVPTIILGDGKQHDRMVGNVTLEYALDAFSKTGDLASYAQTILEEKR